MNMENMRKGALSGYNYIVLTIVFMIFFSTGLAIASESIEGISKVVGITPPSEIRACNTVDEDLYQDDLLLKLGDGYPFTFSEEFDIVTSTLNFTDRYIRLPSTDNEGRHMIQKRFDTYQIVNNISIATSNFVPTGYPDGTNITINLYNESTGYLQKKNLVKQIKITEGYSDIREESFAADDIKIGKMWLEIKMERLNDSYNPMLYYVELRGENTDANVDYPFYREAYSGISRFLGQVKQIGYCGVMQLANLFKAVTFSTGEWWLDMILIPFQIVMVIIIVRIAAEIIASFPFT